MKLTPFASRDRKTRRFKKLLLFMKLTSIFLLVVCMQVAARTNGQTVSLSLRNAPLKKVFIEIQKQTGLNIFMDQALLEKSDRITINVRNMPVQKVLDICLANGTLDYRIDGGAIVVMKKIAPTITNTRIFPPVPMVIKGTVTDENGTPLRGATIKIKGNSLVTSADAEGRFTLEVPDGNYTLVVSYVGFQEQEVNVTGETTVTIIMKQADSKIEEVVVVGYGTKKRANLTGAVEQIKGDDIAMRPASNISTSLQGLLPGLNIQANNGNPGALPDINIRGFNSLNGGGPLILVDGIEGNIERVNPADVESVTVLKDAASSAIYGARGAFGVILITTKKGKAGDIEVRYTNNFGVTTPTTRTDYVSDPYEYGKIIDAALWGYNGTTYTGYNDADWEKIKKVANGEIAPYEELQPDGTYKFFGKTDWYSYLFRKWQPMQNHDISISGGTDKIQGYLSGRYYESKSIQNIIDAPLKKYNLKGNVSFQVNEWLKLSNNLQFSTSDQVEYGGGRTEFGGIWSNTTWYYLWAFHPKAVNGIPYDYAGGGAHAALEDGSNWKRYNSEQLVNTISATITPLKGLVLNMDYSNQRNHIANSTRLNTFMEYTGNRLLLQNLGLNRLTEDRNRSFYNALNIYGNYNHSLGNHNFKLMAGMNHEDFDSDNILGEQGGLLSSSLANLSVGTGLLRADGSASLWVIKGYFGRFNYDFKNKYLLEINARYDGSSRFPEESRWGMFPSVSAGWYLSRENFWEPLKDVVNTFKLRGSYGKLGNQNVGLYTFMQILGMGQTLWLNNGIRQNYVGIPDPLPSTISWESTKTIDFGVDMGFLNNRLNASFDWYEKNTSDMYLPGSPLPSVYGAAEPKENIASLRNRGFELSLSYNNRFSVGGSPLTFRATASVYNFKGVITKYPNPNGVMSTYWEGQKLGELWGYHIAGQFQSDKEAKEYQASFANPSRDLGKVYKFEVNLAQNGEWKGLKAGDIKYVDLDGDGSIDKGNNTIADHGDLVPIGNAMPQFPFGFNAALSWRAIDFSIAGTGVARQDWYPRGNIYWGSYERPYLSFIRKDLATNAWTPETPNNKYPQIYRGYTSLEVGGERSLGEVNDYYLTNVGYLRIRNITIGYTLPPSVIKRMKIKDLRIYASGENIITWRFGKLTKYIDPEQASSGINYNNPGESVKMDRVENYPIGKTFSAGISLSL